MLWWICHYDESESDEDEDIEPYDGEEIHNKRGSDDVEIYNKSDIDETGCNESESDDESEGG